jgi:predicted nucleic acid-binding protein
MVTCVDTSFLYSLYGNDVNTSRAVDWVKSRRRALTLTPLNEYELANALRFAEFRGLLGSGESSRLWAHFEADRSAGRIQVRVCNLAGIVDEAKRLSATHTLLQGHRGFDILHVAAALQLQAAEFLTFDANQRRLANAEELVVPL